MNKDLLHLLEETKELLKEDEKEVDEIQSKIIAMSLYLDEYSEEDKEHLVEEYNRLVEEAKEAGVTRIKRYNLKKKEVKEEEKTKKREVKEEDEIARNILEKSRLLKKKSESFGSMVDVSKDYVDTISGSVRKNVHNVEKGVGSLEKREIFSITTSGLIFIMGIVVLVFILMYALIRIS
ncbi:hypothetical protein NEFER03_1328 [Nematocida sp. LUAm3]|nr:hypothetical protein NEFER03_1328 [Nematocida sp. LUAm3]KAI5174050.1 hypothetical protein NEFER02_0517 [Nematocida sp. LUAm2]KAI5177207.1 hypothetical protein NEFER01_0482 [Nematocida sp. LUAm1]